MGSSRYSAMQQQPMRCRICELPIWLGALGIRVSGGSLHFSMGRVMMESDPILSEADTWGVVESFIIWRGRLLLRIEASHGVVDSSIAEFPRQVGHIVDRDRYSGRASLKRRVRYEHVEQSGMTRCHNFNRLGYFCNGQGILP